jgi:hypothetical protein
MYQITMMVSVRGMLMAQYNHSLLEATDVHLEAFQSDMLIEKNDLGMG